jgi:beta-glucosidase
VGYRYYDAKKMPVQFPFGFGLSYTTFDYSNLQVAEAFTDIDGLTISVDVTNTGDVAGKEIVQVYVHDHEASLSRPIKALKGFAKVDLVPGGTKTVSVSLGFRSFTFYHPDYKNWITEDGDFDILIGVSSQDILLQATTRMTSSLKLPCVLDRESTLKEWIADPRGYAAIKPMILEMQAMFNQEFDADEGIGMDPMGMIMDMRLDNILMFQQHALSKPVDDIVDGFLREAHSMEG